MDTDHISTDIAAPEPAATRPPETPEAGEWTDERLDALEQKAEAIEAKRRGVNQALRFIKLEDASPPESALEFANKYNLNVEIKNLGTDDERTFRGIATTPRVDRGGDIIEPLGAKFAPEIPVFVNHSAAQVVGLARLDKPTAQGISYSARIAQIPVEGPTKTRCDDTWAALKSKPPLFAHVSIGFQPLESEPLPGGGTRYTSIEILELSLVPIPAQPDAKILETKAANPVVVQTKESAVEQWKEFGWFGYSSTEKMLDALQIVLEASLDEYQNDKRGLDDEHAAQSHAVSISQGRYTVLRQLPGMALQHAVGAAAYIARRTAGTLYDEIAARDATIAALAARVSAMESRKAKGLLYRGVFTRTAYAEGDAVTKDGALWIAKCDTGTDGWNFDHWQLAVKSGAAKQ